MKKEEIIKYLDEIFEEQKTVLKFKDILELIKEKNGSKKALKIIVSHEIYNILVQTPKYIFLGDNSWGHCYYFNATELAKIRQRIYYANNKQNRVSNIINGDESDDIDPEETDLTDTEGSI